jgi:hypothetical protein
MTAGRPAGVNFGRAAVNPFLAVAGDPSGHPLTEEEFRRANLGPAKAQLELVNAIRRSLGKDQGVLQVFIGGSFTRPEDWPEMALWLRIRGDLADSAWFQYFDEARLDLVRISCLSYTGRMTPTTISFRADEQTMRVMHNSP